MYMHMHIHIHRPAPTEIGVQARVERARSYERTAEDYWINGQYVALEAAYSDALDTARYWAFETADAFCRQMLARELICIVTRPVGCTVWSVDDIRSLIAFFISDMEGLAVYKERWQRREFVWRLLVVAVRCALRPSGRGDEAIDILLYVTSPWSSHCVCNAYTDPRRGKRMTAAKQLYSLG